LFLQRAAFPIGAHFTRKVHPLKGRIDRRQMINSGGKTRLTNGSNAGMNGNPAFSEFELIENYD